MTPPAITPPNRRLWTPPNVSATNMDKFRRMVNSKRNLSLGNFRELHAWSVNSETAEDFWLELWEYVGIKSSGGPVTKVFDSKTNRKLFPPPAFFPQVRMNFAQHLLSNRDPSALALYECKEGGHFLRCITWGELHSDVTKLAASLVAAGITVGDRVAAVIANRYETIATCLAVLSLGAIWSTSSPDMGVKGVLERLRQIRPKVVFAESKVLYNGVVRDLMPKHREWIRGLADVEEFRTAVIIEEGQEGQEGVGETEGKIVSWKKFVERGGKRELSFVQLPFNHPGFILYSSGTTGPPKCIVHSAGAVLLQVRKDYLLHIDVQPDDILFQYTTTGWMMWAIVLCGLSYGSATVIYDGSPLKPDPMVLLRLVSKLKISIFGTSARFLSDLRTAGYKPRELEDLSSLRSVSSTGSILTAEVCAWFYDEGFLPNVKLVSASGGTDVCCSLVCGDPTSPLYAGEIQAPALGMAIDILDPSSRTPISIVSTGEPGELVCRQPFPSQPVKFWGDETMEKYKAAYFEQGPDAWYQGDFVSVVPSTGGYLMLGRSDGVLNPSGVRFGSAEIYNVTDTIPDFLDTICIGMRRPQDADETVLLFVKMHPTRRLTPALKKSTAEKIAGALTPRHVPKYMFQVSDIPYTVNGKKIENAVKQIVSGRKTKSSGTVANPESLELYRRFFYLEKVLEEERGEGAKL